MTYEREFVGRERELGRLEDALQRALAGEGQVRFVVGEAGTGKTCLVTEFARRAAERHEGLIVATGNCNAQIGIGDPYLPFREVLGVLTGNVEGKVAQGAMSKTQEERLNSALRWTVSTLLEFGPDLVGLFVPGASLAGKVVGKVADHSGWLDDKFDKAATRKTSGKSTKEPSSSDRGIDQNHIFEQCTNVLQAMAKEQPLLVILDDLHWADVGSIGLLFHLGRRLAESRILVIGSFRPDEVAAGRDGERHPLDKLIAEFKRYLGGIEVDLADAATAEGRPFVDALVDAQPNRLGWEFREALFQHTEGHPLFTVELLRDMQERGDLVKDDEGRWIESPEMDWQLLPARVEGVLKERIERLEEELREALSVASVEGEEFTAEVLARVRDVDDRSLVRRLSGELDKQHRLVQARGTERIGQQRLSLYRFRHNLFQHYLYGALDAVEREYLHEDVGTVLETLYGERAEEIAPQLARHFLEAGDPHRALPYVLIAGTRAQEVYANEEAVAHYRDALGLIEELGGEFEEERARTHERLADVLVSMGDNDAALEHYQAVLDLLGDGSRGPERVAAIQRKVAGVHRLAGEYDTALEWLDRALATLGSALCAEAARICLEMSAVLYRQGHATKALEWSETALKIAEACGDETEVAYTCMLRTGILGDLGETEKALAAGERSLSISESTGDLQVQAKALNNLANRYYHAGDWQKAAEHYQKSLEIRERIGDVGGAAIVSNNLGELYLIQGRLDEAIECFDRCLTTWGRTGFDLGIALSHRNLGQSRLRLGEHDKARQHLESSRQVLLEMKSRGWVLAEVFRHLAELELARENLAAAESYGEQALALVSEQEIRVVEANARRVLADVRRKQGNWAGAAELLQQSLSVAKDQEQRYERGLALLSLAQLYAEHGKAAGRPSDERREKAVSAAIAIFDALSARWDLERAREMLGAG